MTWFPLLLSQRTAARRAGLQLRFQFSEGFAHFVYGVDPFVSFDLEQQWRGVWRRSQQLHGLFPVDGSASRPKMSVAIFGVVVDVTGMDGALDGLEGLGH